MKKFWLKVIVFLGISTVLFLIVQEVLHYRWAGREDVYTRNILYSQEPEGSIDVLFFGTSEIYSGVTPIVLYHEAGITSWNMAISQKSAITTYYQVEYALKYQTPKIVACDFESLLYDSLPKDDELIEALYRKVSATTPDWDIKRRLIHDICAEDETQDALSYYLPLLRYHSMWNELDESNFQKDYVVDEEYPAYAKGAELVDADYSDEYILELTEDLWNTENQELLELSEVSVKYYDRMIELCQNKGITVVALLPPKLSNAAVKEANWETIQAYLQSRGVVILDYKNYDEIKRIDLDLQEDYYNSAHLNYKGSFKWSKDLGPRLKEICELPDHREDEVSVEWDAEWKDFSEVYDYNEDS